MKKTQFHFTRTISFIEKKKNNTYTKNINIFNDL